MIPGLSDEIIKCDQFINKTLVNFHLSPITNYIVRKWEAVPGTQELAWWSDLGFGALLLDAIHMVSTSKEVTWGCDRSWQK